MPATPDDLRAAEVCHYHREELFQFVKHKPDIAATHEPEIVQIDTYQDRYKVATNKKKKIVASVASGVDRSCTSGQSSHSNLASQLTRGRGMGVSGKSVRSEQVRREDVPLFSAVRRLWDSPVLCLFHLRCDPKSEIRNWLLGGGLLPSGNVFRCPEWDRSEKFTTEINIDS